MMASPQTSQTKRGVGVPSSALVLWCWHEGTGESLPPQVGAHPSRTNQPCASGRVTTIYF